MGSQSDRCKAIAYEVGLSILTIGIYTPWAITKACKGEILPDSRQIIQKRTKWTENLMVEIGKLLTESLFVLNEFRPVALEKMSYVRARLQQARKTPKMKTSSVTTMRYFT